MDFGHWEYFRDFEPEEWFGFIYRIVDLTNGREYIGKKQFERHIKKKVKTKAGGTRNRRVTKASDWKTYTSSSVHINAAIEEKGKENFLFLIESLHRSKAGLFYAEIETQINEDVLRARLPSGERKYYNGMVGNVKFLPPIDSEDETQHRASKTTRSFDVGCGVPDEIKEEVRLKYRLADRN
jgi:hypothetical protein